MKVYDGAYNAVQLDLFTPYEDKSAPPKPAHHRFDTVALPNLYAMLIASGKNGTSVFVRNEQVVASMNVLMDSASTVQTVELHTPYGTVQLRCRATFVHAVCVKANTYTCYNDVRAICNRIERWLAGHMTLPAGQYSVQLVDCAEPSIRIGIDVGGETVAQVAAGFKRMAEASLSRTGRFTSAQPSIDAVPKFRRDYVQLADYPKVRAVIHSAKDSRLFMCGIDGRRADVHVEYTNRQDDRLFSTDCATISVSGEKVLAFRLRGDDVVSMSIGDSRVTNKHIIRRKLNELNDRLEGDNDAK